MHAGMYLQLRTMIILAWHSHPESAAIYLRVDRLLQLAAILCLTLWAPRAT